MFACVVPVPGVGPLEDELIEFCERHLASFKKPRRVEIVDDLRKSAYGKVLHCKLKEQYKHERIEA